MLFSLNTCQKFNALQAVRNSYFNIFSYEKIMGDSVKIVDIFEKNT